MVTIPWSYSLGGQDQMGLCRLLWGFEARRIFFRAIFPVLPCGASAGAASVGNCWERLSGAASCQAAAMARYSVVFSAASRLTLVQPLSPQAPFTGVKTEGSARTSISCSTGVTFTIARSLLG